MIQITYASQADVSAVYGLMMLAKEQVKQKDWYSTDGADFVQRHGSLTVEL